MEENIIKKTKIGILWNIIERFSIQIVTFIIGIILARLLTPDDYGTVGLLTVFLTIANVFVDSGFSKGLIQKIDRTEEDYSTTLIFNFIVSIIIYLILFFVSPYIACFYQKDELTLLARVLFLVIILSSLTVVQSAILQIKVDFKKIALINFVATFISGVFGIIIAYKGLGVWALVVQNLVRNFIALLMYWGIGRWIPTRGFSITSFKKLFSYGSNLLITGLLSTIISNLQSLIIGKLYKPASLGYYTRAMNFPQLISGTATSVLQTTTFPLLSKYQNNNTELIKVFKRIIHLTYLSVFPMMIGLAMISKTLIIVLLTEKWIIASEYLFWLSIGFVFAPLEILNLNLLNAIGRSDLNLKIDLIKMPLIVLCMAITLPIGLKAVVIGGTCFSIVYYIIDSYMVGKLYNFGACSQLFNSWKVIVATIIMAICLKFLSCLFISETIIKLVAMVLGGAIIYSVCLLLLKENEIFIIFNNIKKIIMRNKP